MLDLPPLAPPCYLTPSSTYTERHTRLLAKSASYLITVLVLRYR